MKIYVQNIRGANTKARFIRPSIQSCVYDIIILLETWLQAGFCNSELFPPSSQRHRNFNVYRRDRDLDLTGKQTGGGIIIGVRAGYKSERLLAFECPNLEMVWLRVDGEYPLYICSCYMPDRSNHAQYSSFLKAFHDNIALIPESDARIMLVGDFNLNTVDWNWNGRYMTPTNYLNDDPGNVNADFIHTANCFDLCQFNSTSNANGRYLDLLLTDIECSKIRCIVPDTVLSDRVDSHHPPLQFDVNMSKPAFLDAAEPRRLNFRTANYEAIVGELSCFSWERLLTGVDVDMMVVRFYKLLRSVIERHTVVRQRPGKYPVWYSCSLIFMLNEKNRLHKAYKETNDHSTYLEFKRLRTAVKLKTNRCYMKYIEAVEDGMKTHMKVFWKYTKTLRKTNTYPSSLSYPMSVGGTVSASDSPSIARLFAAYFQSVFNPCPAPTFTPVVHTSTRLDTLEITEDQILSAIKKLDPDKGAGTDGIPSFFVKAAASALVTPLLLIFNASLAAGVFPVVFKSTLIHPVHKAGAADNVTNYRPIAVLNCFAKLFERVVHQAMLEHVTPFLDSSQHGFLPKRGTVTNLLEYVTFLNEKLENREQVDVLYVDLSKAFDRISHDILIYKLQSFGITGQLKLWLATYLIERSNIVVFNGAESDRFFPTSGVPQGSILGPLLFVLYVDDMASVLSSFKSRYADDTKFGRTIMDESDCVLLLNDLHALETWCERNNLSSNPSKCNVLTITNKLTPTTYQYTSIDGTVIPRATAVKDLGVYVDTTLKFDVHVEAVVNKAFKALGFVIRTSRSFKSITSVMHLYRSLVLPHLEYCCPVWSPYYLKYVNAIESVQRRFTRYVFRKFNIAYSDYETRCKWLFLQTLRRRRVMHDQILLYKLVKRTALTDPRIVSISYRVNSITRSQDRFVERKWVLRSSHSAPIPRMLRHHNKFFWGLNLSDRLPEYRANVCGILEQINVDPDL